MPDQPFLYQLKDTLELAYKDGITRILNWQTDFDQIKGQFLDGKNLFSFSITPDSVSYQPIAASQKEDSLPRLDKASLCKVGRSCGDTCISRTKGCRVEGFRVSRAATLTLAGAKTEVVLKEHQTRIAEKLQNQKGLIVYHGLGSGKTLTAINAAEQYGGAAVITPASLRENFIKELAKSGAKGNYDLYSYDEFRMHPPDLKGRMLIVDEAHRLRNSSTQTTQAIAGAAKDANKVLLLTGTPLQNKPHEIAPLINIAAGEDVLPGGEEAFNNRYISKRRVKPSLVSQVFTGASAHTIVQPKNLKEFKQQAAQYVDHYQPTQEGYPNVTKHTVEVEMDKGQIATYRTWAKGMTSETKRKMRDNLPLDKQGSGELNAFINANRQISNTPQGFDRNSHTISPKLKTIADSVETSGGPSLIYSNYLYSGTMPLSNELERRNIKHSTFTGDMNDKQKKQAVDDYNSGKIRALIVSSSGGEGLDLKNTAQVHIMEPHWHGEKIQQVVGRAIRYQSHASLPEDKRHVDVFQYISAMPEPWAPWAKKETTADQYLNEMSQKKKELNDHFLSRLKGDRKDAYSVGFLASKHGVGGLLALDSSDYWAGYLAAGQKRTDKACQCKVGRPCGEGCVSRSKACHVKTSAGLSRGEALLTVKLPKADRIIKTKEDEIRLNFNESAHAYDMEGNPLFSKDGEKSAVFFTGEEIKKMNGAVMTHNHPAAATLGMDGFYGGSFSEADWACASLSKLGEMRAVGPEARYSLKPPKEGWSIDWWRAKGEPAFKKHKKAVYGELIPKVMFGKMTSAQADAEFHHQVAERTAKELGATYTRQLTQITAKDRATILSSIPKRS